VIGVSTLSAQTPLLFENESAYAVAPKRASNLPATDLTAYRFHKKLPQLFTGFAIEVAASNFPLQRNNPVFRQFGNIHYEKLREGGYSYLILASFSSREAALNFLNEIILPKVPEARLFDYKDGIRKVIRE
jgi:hypothetical protein